MSNSYLTHYFAQTPPEKHSRAAIAMLAGLDHLTESSPTIAAAIVAELQDQRSHLKLIASENFSSLAVQLAMGNWLTDKYAEGYPFHRFYAGCQNVDAIEDEAVTLCKKLFGCDHAYIQPHSGADANLVAYWSILVQRVQNREVERLQAKSVDTLSQEEYERIRQLMLSQKVMGLSLSSGGHLTHGYRHNISSKMMQAVHYDVDPVTHLIDYDVLAKQVLQEKPLILLAGYSAYSRRINFARMREIADSVGAVLMVDMAHFAGLVAGKVFQGDENPVPFAHIITSTTHKTLRGPRGGLILCTEEFAETINKGCPLVLGGPLPHVMAAKAVAFREALSPDFVRYAHAIVDNARSLAEAFLKRGQTVITGGTDNHLLLLNVASFGLTGRQAETALREGLVTTSRNTLPPNDPNGPWYTSGIRMGTAALTTLGMGIKEMDIIAGCVVDLLRHTKPDAGTTPGQMSKAKSTTDPIVLQRICHQLTALLEQYPLYPELLLPHKTSVT